MKLPEACADCAPFAGRWRHGRNGGMERCGCARGVALTAASSPVARSPAISETAATIYAEALAVIPFFPGEAAARASVADEIACMCGGPEDAQWLVRRMRRLYRKWPGIAEMRLVYCAGRQPRDGIQAICDSEAYPDGIPGEAESASAGLLSSGQHQLAGVPDPRAMAEELTNSPSIAAMAAKMALSKDINRVGRRNPKVPELPVFGPNVKLITEADFEAEKARQRDAKAREEAGLVAK